MIYVTQADYIDGHRLYLKFSNKREGMVDLAQVMQHDHRPIFNELSEIEAFKRFHVEADTVVWENGLDLAPEFLLEKLRDTNADAEFFDKMNS